MTREAIVLALLLFLSFSTTSFPADPTSSDKALAIVGGNLLDVRTGVQTEDVTLVIDENRIREVGPSDRVAIPPTAEVIVAKDRWILPGFVEMHTHINGEEKLLLLELFLANGVTSIRDVGGNVTELRLLREELEAGRVVGPRLAFCGPILDGTPPLWPDLSLVVDTPQQARSAVGFLADQGVDCIKVYNSITEHVLETIVEEARSRKLPVVGHVPRTMTMTRAVELGLTGLEHVRIPGRELLTQEEAARIDGMPYAKRETLLWQTFDLESSAMHQLVRFLAVSDVFLDPTLLVAEDTFVLDHSAQMAHPDNRFIPRKLHEKWRVEWEELHERSDVMRVPTELKEAALQSFDKRKGFVAMSARAGVPIVAGTDGPLFGTLLPGFGIHHELELLVESGLTNLQAIQAATITAARALGWDNDLGSIERGKYADVVIVNGDPLADISNTRNIHMVIKDGLVYEPRRLLVSSEKES